LRYLQRSICTVVGLLVVSCCIEQEKAIELKGEVSYPDYEEGKVVMKLCEEETSTCGRGITVQKQTPGKCVKTLELDSPGPFEIRANIHWVDEEPDIELLAWLIKGDEEFYQSTICAHKTLPPWDARNLELVLEARESGCTRE
jgi:hypothetical protein